MERLAAVAALTAHIDELEQAKREDDDDLPSSAGSVAGPTVPMRSLSPNAAVLISDSWVGRDAVHPSSPSHTYHVAPPTTTPTPSFATSSRLPGAWNAGWSPSGGRPPFAWISGPAAAVRSLRSGCPRTVARRTTSALAQLIELQRVQRRTTLGWRNSPVARRPATPTPNSRDSREATGTTALEDLGFGESLGINPWSGREFRRSVLAHEPSASASQKDSS
jgi:hypothetical protein